MLTGPSRAASRVVRRTRCCARVPHLLQPSVGAQTGENGRVHSGGTCGALAAQVRRIPPASTRINGSINMSKILGQRQASKRASPQKPTPAQRAVLEFLRAYRRLHGRSASHAEIAAGVQLAHPSSCRHLLASLEVRGWIRQTRGARRAIELLHHGTVPVVRAPQRIKASESLAIDHATDEEMPEISTTWMQVRPDFFLLAEGLNAPSEDLEGCALLAVSIHVEPRDGNLVISRQRGRILCVRYRSHDGAHIEGVVVGTIAVHAVG